MLLPWLLLWLLQHLVVVDAVPVVVFMVLINAVARIVTPQNSPNKTVITFNFVSPVHFPWCCLEPAQ